MSFNIYPTVASVIQLDAANEISSLGEKSTLVAADLFLIEDSAASNVKKKVQYSNVGLGASAGKWVVITASGDQASIDESTPDLVTAWDTLEDGSTSHGVTVSAGVITLPANTSGYKWELRAEVFATHTAAGQVAFRFYSAPAGANTAIGLEGLANTATYTGNASSGGTCDALAWVTGTGTVGLRCTVATGATTVTLNSDWSRIIVREVKA